MNPILDFDQAPAVALTMKGDSSNWAPHNNPPDYSIGFPMEAGSWPTYDVRDGAPDKLVLWRSPHPDENGSLLWHQPGRYGTIDAWKPKKATGWFLFEFLRDLKQLELDLKAAGTPLVIPWNKRWKTPGGTGAHKDNGIIVQLDDHSGYNLLGLRPVNLSDIAMAKIITLGAASLAEGHYVVDSISYWSPGTKPHGSQGPKWKHDGLLRPDHLTSFDPDIEFRLVGFNVQYGPEAKWVAPGWRERPLYPKTIGFPYGPHAVYLPPGDHPDMIPSYTGFALVISDYEIEEWIESLELDPMLDPSPDAHRWYARNLRGYISDADAPAVPKTRIRLAESGTGHAIIESVGNLNPVHATAFAEVGVTNDKASYALGRNLLKYGYLIVTDGQRVA